MRLNLSVPSGPTAVSFLIRFSRVSVCLRSPLTLIIYLPVYNIQRSFVRRRRRRNVVKYGRFALIKYGWNFVEGICESSQIIKPLCRCNFTLLCISESMSLHSFTFIKHKYILSLLLGYGIVLKSYLGLVSQWLPVGQNT